LCFRYRQKPYKKKGFDAKDLSNLPRFFWKFDSFPKARSIEHKAVHLLLPPSIHHFFGVRCFDLRNRAVLGKGDTAEAAGSRHQAQQEVQ
jgi:hypothetical protein